MCKMVLNILILTTVSVAKSHNQHKIQILRTTNTFIMRDQAKINDQVTYITDGFNTEDIDIYERKIPSFPNTSQPCDNIRRGWSVSSE